MCPSTWFRTIFSHADQNHPVNPMPPNFNGTGHSALTVRLASMVLDSPVPSTTMGAPNRSFRLFPKASPPIALKMFFRQKCFKHQIPARRFCENILFDYLCVRYTPFFAVTYSLQTTMSHCSILIHPFHTNINASSLQTYLRFEDLKLVEEYYE